MKYIFWQEFFSLHQCSFLNALSITNEVTIVVEKSINARRINDGWQIPSYNKSINIVINPKMGEILDLLEQPNIVNIFFGIDAYLMVFKVFKIAIKKKLTIAIMQEPIHWVGYKGLPRVLKWIAFRIVFSRKILFYLNTGYSNAKIVNRLCYPQAKLFDWAYFIDPSKNNSFIEKQTINRELPNIIFIGTINKNKNIIDIVKLLKKHEDRFHSFTIIGNGPLEYKLKKVINGNTKFNFLGRKERSEIWDQIYSSDLLLLPSKWDGWGYVVNEALHCGIPVIASNRCGASCLLDGELRGSVFSKNKINNILIKWLDKTPLNLALRKLIIDWSDQKISGTAGAKYFEEVVGFSLNKDHIKSKPTPPWLT